MSTKPSSAASTPPDSTFFRVSAGLCLLIVAAAATLAARSRTMLAVWPLSEDGFYAFTVARNIALGRGPSADGTTLTNGFQPLFTLATVPLFAAAPHDRLLAIRLVMVVHALVYAGTALLVGRIAAAVMAELRPSLQRTAGWASALVYLAHPLVFRSHFNGLETGCALLLYALIWRYCQTRTLERPAERLALGGLLGLLVLARIDAVFFVGLICAYLFWMRPRTPLGARFRRAAEAGAVACLVSAPWWAYNLWLSGSPMPSSGAAQAAWALAPERILYALVAIARIAVPWWRGFDAGRFDLGLGGDAARGLLVAGGLILLRHKGVDLASGDDDSVARPRARHVLMPGACLCAAVVVLAAWYAASSFAVWFYVRYLSPLAIVGAVVLGCWIAVLASRRAPLALGLCALLAAPVPYDCMASHWRLLDGRNVMYVTQLRMVEGAVPPGELVAALQSGTLGFFRDGVVNLDGKVNRAALARREDIWTYLDERGIRWLCDWPRLFKTYFGSTPDKHGWTALTVEGSGKFILYRRTAEAPPRRPANASAR